MAVFIHHKSHFTKYLRGLRRAGGRAASAAEQAEAIIGTLAAAPATAEPVHRLTKFGERRIEGCQKYDLGAGYCLVYVKDAEHTMFLFVGTHDDCDRWLTNNKYLHNLQLDRVDDEAEHAPEPKVARDMDYDDLLMQHVDEQTLHRVFHGLCGN